MSDPSLALQKAVFDLIKGHSPPPAGGRIFDQVPVAAAYPYITFGDVQVVDDSADCIDATQVFFTLDVWSRPGPTTPGATEAKRIGAELRALLHDTVLTLDGGSFRNVDLQHQDTSYLRDVDALTVHGVVRFAALIDKA